MQHTIELSSSSRLTDSLERDLLAQAMEDQYQPHPLVALAHFAKKVVGFAKSIRATTMNHDMM